MRLAIALIAAMAATYGSMAWHELQVDDYYTMRPWSADELRSAWTGSWDPLHINDVYYRPLVATYQAAAAALFGARPLPHHLLSLAGLALASWLIGVFVRRETRSTGAGAFATLVLAVHPYMSVSVAGSAVLQINAISLIVLALALLEWQRVRDRSTARWWRIAVLALVGILTKEDLLMIVPIVVALQAARPWWDRAAQPVTGPLIISGVTVTAALIAIRLTVFSAPGPLSAPLGWFQWSEFWFAPIHTLFVVGGPGLMSRMACVAFTLTACAGGVMLWRSEAAGRGDAGVLVIGAIVMAGANIPLLFFSGASRVHLVAGGACFVIAGAGHLLWRRLAGPRWLLAGAAVLLITSVAVGRDRIATFAPCSTETLDLNEGVRDMPRVPEPIRRAVAGIPALCREGRATAISPSLIDEAWRAARESAKIPGR
jgi:hypothetical protein